RQAPTLDRIGSAEARDQVLQPDLGDLPAVRIGAEAEAARRRQASARKRRQVGGLGPDAIGVGRSGAAQIDAEPRFVHWLAVPCRGRSNNHRVYRPVNTACAPPLSGTGKGKLCSRPEPDLGTYFT